MRIHVLAPSGNFVPRPGHRFLLLARERDHADDVDLQVRAVTRAAARSLWCTPTATKSVIFASVASRPGGRIPRPADRRALAGVGAGVPTATALATLVAPFTDREAFICGPGPSWPRPKPSSGRNRGRRIHLEVFQSLDSDPLRRGQRIEDDSDEAPPPQSSNFDGRPTSLRGRAKPCCWTCCWTRGWMRRSPAARVTAGHARSAAQRSGEMEVNDVLEPSGSGEGLILAARPPRDDSVEVTYDE